MARFKITITKIETKEITDREYQKVADTGNERDEGAVYDYVEFPSTKTVSTEVYTQDIEDLDVKAVISAANKMVYPGEK